MSPLVKEIFTNPFEYLGYVILFVFAVGVAARVIVPYLRETWDEIKEGWND